MSAGHDERSSGDTKTAKSRRTRKRVTHELEGAAGGAAVGAVAGLIAGPAGVAVGAALGAVAGAVAEAVLEHDKELDRQHDAVLDAIIGVTSGEIGAPNLKHPPAKIGAYSGSSMGVSAGGGRASAEGPFEDVDE